MTDLSTGLPTAAGARYDVVIADTRYWAVTPDDLRARGIAEEAVRDGVAAALGRRVDEDAERVRLSVVTPGAGQAMEYQEAQAQAIAALAGDPAAATPERYPMLAATINLDTDPATGRPATDVLGVARAVMVAYRLWRSAGSAIRAARLSGKAAIRAAPSVAAAEAAYAAIAWPSLD